MDGIDSYRAPLGRINNMDGWFLSPLGWAEESRAVGPKKGRPCDGSAQVLPQPQRAVIPQPRPSAWVIAPEIFSSL